MFASVRGRCLVINNSMFGPSFQYRDHNNKMTVQLDTLHLVALFEQLHFQVIVANNQTAQVSKLTIFSIN